MASTPDPAPPLPPVWFLRGRAIPGGLLCRGKGAECVVVSPVTAPQRLTATHDESLAQLTREYNRLIEPYLKPRDDGRRLRLVYTSAGEAVFAWVTCYGDDVSDAEVEARHGKASDDPEDLRRALGLPPR
jgi:hypothetical protein